jgi:threonine/homoserine/homoserine lactone efflux protein
MSEIPRWRRTVLRTGIVIVLLNGAYFIVGLSMASSFIRSDSAYGWFISSGMLCGAISFVCGILGKGIHRWKLVVGAGVETLVWWFMAVGG